MKKDHFRDTNLIDKGRKKVFILKEGNIELPNPKNGISVGYLDKGDLVYLVKPINENGVDMLVFRVMKYAGKKHQNTLFKAKADLFENHFKEDESKNSNADGDENKNEDKKQNYVVPAVIGVSLGAVGYLIAQKYQKNVWAFAIGGLLIGGTLGYIVANKKTKNK